jgi:hypothetical protein
MSDRYPQHRLSLHAAALRLAVPLTTLFLATGCGGGQDGGTHQAASTEPASPAPLSESSAPTPADGRRELLSQYRALWSHLTEASHAPASERRAILSRYAADPELSSLLRGMRTADAKGQVFYGQDRARPKITSFSASRGIAVVDDCLDSRHSGLADKRSGEVITRGVRRNHVVVTMHLVSDAWRVAFVSYPSTHC